MSKENIVIKKELIKNLVIEDKVFGSVYDYSLSEEDLEKARKDLGETKELKESSLRKLKEKLSRDKNIHYRTDDAYLLRFLRYRKFDCEKTYKHIREFNRKRIEMPEPFLVSPNVRSHFDARLGRCLPYRDAEGSLIFWIDIRNWNLEEISSMNAMQLITLVGDLYTVNAHCQVNGIIDIFDFRGLTAGHCAQILNLRIAALFLKCLQDFYPWRVKRIIILYANRIVRAGYYALSCMIKKKIADKVVLLGSDLSELHRYVDPTILPKEYGGTVEEKDCLMTDFIMDNLPYVNYERSFASKLKR